MVPGNRFVGRKEHLETFEHALDQLSDGKGSFILISGRAGIGKTVLTQQYARLSERHGAVCVSTTFPTFAESLPYWGWTRILRDLADSTTRNDAATLARSLLEGDTYPQQSSQLLVFEKLSAELSAMAELRPLVIMLDDIQNADFASLSVLEALVAEISGYNFIVVASFRDSDLQASPPRGVAKLPSSLASRAQRVLLRGIDELECAQLCQEMTGWAPDAALVRRLHMQTEGNPLFLRQIMIALMEAGHVKNGVADLPDRLEVPAGISEMIGVRVDRVGERCRTALEHAAILGHSWELAVLEKLVPDLDPIELDEAQSVGLIDPINLQLGQWQFTHALIREVLYDNVPPVRRLHAHAQAAFAIEALFGEEDPKIISALAYHAFEGQIFAGTMRAIELARNAGEHAVGVAAYQDAAAHFRIALECFDVPGIDETEQKIEAALQLAKAERLAGENLSAIKTSRRALEWARYRSDWPRYAKAALSYEAARWQPGLPSKEVVECIELALSNSDEISASDIVRLRFSLARGLQRIGKIDEALVHGRRSIEEAREIGDKALICDALDQGTSAYACMPGTLRERRETGVQQRQLATELGDKVRLSNALVNYGTCLAQSGQFDDLKVAHSELENLARELAQPHFRYVACQWSTLFAMLDGNFQEAANLARTALKTSGAIAGANGAGVYGIQMFLINRDRGVLDGFAEFLKRIEDSQAGSFWEPGRALLLAEIGEHDRATAILDELAANGLDNLPLDDMRSLTLAFMAEVVWLTRKAEHARILYQALSDLSGETILLGPATVCFGPVDRSLGLLQACMQNYDLAREWLEGSLEQIQSWPSKPHALRTACDLCEVLILEGSPSAIKRAGELHAQFGVDATTAGMASISRRLNAIDDELHRLASARGYHDLTAREVEVLRKLAHGASNAKISQDLGISHATVASHVRNILSKTASKNRTAAAAFARQQGLVGDYELS